MTQVLSNECKLPAATSTPDFSFCPLACTERAFQKTGTTTLYSPVLLFRLNGPSSPSLLRHGPLRTGKPDLNPEIIPKHGVTLNKSHLPIRDPMRILGFMYERSVPGCVLTAVLEKVLPGYQGQKRFSQPHIRLSLILAECRKNGVEKSAGPTEGYKVTIRQTKDQKRKSRGLPPPVGAPAVPPSVSSLLGNPPKVFLLYPLRLECKKDPEAANIEELE